MPQSHPVRFFGSNRRTSKNVRCLDPYRPFDPEALRDRCLGILGTPPGGCFSGIGNGCRRVDPLRLADSNAAHSTNGGHLVGRSSGGFGNRGRLRSAPSQNRESRCRSAPGGRATGRGGERTQSFPARSRVDVRTGNLHRQPSDDRRHGGEQLLRIELPGLRLDKGTPRLGAGIFERRVGGGLRSVGPGAIRAEMRIRLRHAGAANLPRVPQPAFQSGKPQAHRGEFSQEGHSETKHRLRP